MENSRGSTYFLIYLLRPIWLESKLYEKKFGGRKLGKFIVRKLLFRFAILIFSVQQPLISFAQIDEIDSGVLRLSLDENNYHRQVLAQPIPTNVSPDALEKYFSNKRLSAWKIGDKTAVIKVLREAVSALPNILFFAMTLHLC